MKLVRWTPMDNIVSSFARDFEPFMSDRFFGNRWPRMAGNRVWERNWSPVVDVEEKDSEIVLNAELPGMTKADIDITIEDDVLTLSGEKKTSRENGNEENGSYRSERFFGKFERSFTLPSSVVTSKAKATFKNGILEILLPKKEEARSRKITIS